MRENVVCRIFNRNLIYLHTRWLEEGTLDADDNLTEFKDTKAFIWLKCDDSATP